MLIAALQVSAQTDTNQKQALPQLTEDYYNGVTFLKQNYNYEAVNKKRALKKRSNDVLILGAICGTAGIIGTSYIAEKNGWSMAVSIPVGIAVCAGVIFPFSAWNGHLTKKANAIQVESAYVLPVGKQTDLGAALFTDRNELGIHAIGIGIKTTF